MIKILRLASYAALVLILISALLCAAGRITSETNLRSILAGTIAWFIGATICSRKKAAR